MENRPQDSRYEQLYAGVQARVKHIHERNKSRVRFGTIVLILLPLILGLVRWLTDSDKALFLLIWVLCMFAVSAYLIGVEYLDHSIRKSMEELTNEEDGFDSLIGGNGPALQARKEMIGEKMRKPVEMIHKRKARISEDPKEKGGD